MRDDKFAEAARYAVLSRTMPVLRHDVAGSLQPIRLLVLVLERRLQHAEPDLAAIAKSVSSLSTLVKQASVNCVDAMSWIGSVDDCSISLRSGVDEAITLLAPELSISGISVINDISDDSLAASQSMMRSVCVGALLAFCDEQPSGGVLEVTYEKSSEGTAKLGVLHLFRQQNQRGDEPMVIEATRKLRMVGWDDVEAIARSCGVTMTQGPGWVRLIVAQR